jgi:DNA-binding protein HU-beta
MTRSDLIRSIVATTSLSRKEAAEAVDAVFKTISRALKRGHEVELPGLGTFTASERTRSIGRNPRTAEAVEMPRSQVRVRAAKRLTEGARGGGDDDGHGGARRTRRK